MNRLQRSGPRAGARLKQRGIALVMALIVMVVVSILGVVAMRTAIFQNRISLNTQVSQRLFQAAESGLDAAMNVSKVALVSGVDGVKANGDEYGISDPRLLFNIAAGDMDRPRRVCMTGGGAVSVDNGENGWRNAETGEIGYNDGEACDVVDGELQRVTVMVGPSPEQDATPEGNQLGSVAAAAVRVQAEAEIPGTNIRTTHAEDWLGPQTPLDDMSM